MATWFGATDTFGSYNLFYRFTGAFGCADSYCGGNAYADHLRLVDGKVTFTAMDEAFKKTAEFFNMLYEEGLIWNGSFEADSSMAFNASLIKENVAKIGSFGVWGDQEITNQEVHDQYVAVPRLQGEDGMTGFECNYSELQDSSDTAITTTCKFPHVVARFVDYMVGDPEISVTSNWGAIGYNYEKDEDGILRTPLDENGNYKPLNPDYKNFGEARVNSTTCRGSMIVQNEYYDTVCGYTFDAVKHLPVALYPDEIGTMYSGSMAYDENNTSGFAKYGEKPMVAVYTAHNMETGLEQQCIAYSLDQGKHFEKYYGNPVIKNPGAPDFRDPRVFWNDKKDCWSLVLASGDHAEFYASQDLKNWKKTGEFGVGVNKVPTVWECTDLIRAKTGNEFDGFKWILIVSMIHPGTEGRANIQYFVGDFDGDTFQCTEITDEPLWIDFGFDNYAGVTYGNYDRPVYLGWGVNPLYANFVPTGEYSGLMTLPRELSLCETDEGYRLKTKPFGIDEYRAGAFPIGNQKPLLTESFGLLVQGNFGRIALKNSRGEEVVIEVTVDSITVDRSKSGDLSYFDDVDPKLFKKEDLLVSTTKRYMRGNVNMEIIFDVSYLEIYADGGLEIASVCVYPDAPYQVVSTDGDLEVKMYTIKK